MIAFVALVLPDMYCVKLSAKLEMIVERVSLTLTESIAVAHLGSPATHQMYLVLRNGSHLGVPLAHKLCVLVHLIGLHLVEDNGMDILATSQDLGEAALDVFLQLSAFGRTIYERRECAAFLLTALLLTDTGFLCCKY